MSAVAWQFRRAGSDEAWSLCLNDQHKDNTAASPDWEVRALYASDALLELAAEWRARSLTRSTDNHGCGLSDALFFCAEELTALLTAAAHPDALPDGSLSKSTMKRHANLTRCGGRK